MKQIARKRVAIGGALLACISCASCGVDTGASDAAVPSLAGLILPISQIEEGQFSQPETQSETGPRLAPGHYAVSSIDRINGGTTSSDFCAYGADTSEVLLDLQTLSFSQACRVESYSRDNAEFEAVMYCQTPDGHDRWSSMSGRIGPDAVNYTVSITGTGLMRNGIPYTTLARRLGDC